MWRWAATGSLWCFKRFLGVRAPPPAAWCGHAPVTRPPEEPDEWEPDMMPSGRRPLLPRRGSSGEAWPLHPSLDTRIHSCSGGGGVADGGGDMGEMRCVGDGGADVDDGGR